MLIQKQYYCIYVCRISFVFVIMFTVKGNQKGNITCYARERANTKQPF